MDNFSYYTVQELKRYARENNIRLAGLTRKADIIEIIKEHLSTTNIEDTQPQSALQTSSKVQLASETQPSWSNGSNLMSLCPSDDLFYELVKKLSLNNIKSLCSSSRQYRTLCQKERFQQLFRRKADEEENLFYDQLAKFLLDNFIYLGSRISWKGKGHNISYISDHKRFSEEIYDQRFEDYRVKSILYSIFGDESLQLDNRTGRWLGRYFRIDNPKMEQIIQVLKILWTRPDLKLDEFYAHLTSKELRELCENKKEYEILCQSDFYKKLVDNIQQRDK